MSTETSSLFALLVALNDDRLLLPNLAVAEIVALDGLQPAPPGAPGWYLGRLPWQGLEIPVARFESLNGARVVAPGRRARVIILNTLSPALTVGHYGLVCESYPRLATLEPDALEAQPPRAGDLPEAVLGRALIGGELVAIPNLERIELDLAQLEG